MFRLVITPQTERCQIAISEALQSRCASYVFGPTSGGKTETIKDLARTLGRLSVHYNCNENVNIKTLGKILSGLIQVGAWGCLENLFSVDSTVLIVLAQQIRSVSDAIAEHAERFVFDGKTMRIDDNYALFSISGNTNYRHTINFYKNKNKIK